MDLAQIEKSIFNALIDESEDLHFYNICMPKARQLHMKNHISKCKRSPSILDYFYDEEIEDYNFSIYANDAELLMQLKIGYWRDPQNFPELGGTSPVEVKIDHITELINLRSASALKVTYYA